MSRNIAIVIEIKNAIKYLRNGLCEIQKLSSRNEFYDPSLIFLSGGLERLFKSMICLNYKEKNGVLPTYKELLKGNNGHNIEYLKSEVERMCIPVTRPFASMDYDIITKDVLINRICKTLSEYGQRARYFNLDIILGNSQNFDSKKEWEKIESLMLKEHYGESEFYSNLLEQNQIDLIYEKLNQLIVGKIELFLRAITRQFTFGNFSKKSKGFLFEVDCFSEIKDNQIGKTDYRLIPINQRIKR